MIENLKESLLFQRFLSFKTIIEGNKLYLGLFTFLSCFIILFIRRGTQLMMPEVWDEDGTQNLISFINNGWSFLLKPVNGYLITISKLITGTSASISILYYPEVSTYITWIFQALVGTAIALSPTHLKHKYLCALAVFIVPTDPEVLGIPLYSFWFTSLLLFLVILWKKDEINILTFIYLIIGGLSSPVMAIVPFFLIFRRVVQKDFLNKRLIILFIVALMLTLLQGYYIYISKASQGRIEFDYSFFYQISKKFIGYYYIRFTGMEKLCFWGGITLMLYLLFSVYDQYVKRKSSLFAVMVLLFGASIFLSISRLDYIVLHPILAGPRYFFFPFIFLSWILIYNLDSRFYQIPAVFLTLALINSLFVFQRKHDDLPWREDLKECSCLGNGNFPVSVHFNGDANEKWAMNLPSKTCTQILKEDLFSSNDLLKCDIEKKL